MKRLFCGVALALLAAPALFAQMGETQKPATMSECAAMMQQHEGMQKHMVDMNAKLQSLVDAMNTAKGSARVDKMAAVINELVAQRAMMQKEMMEMQPAMMAHMMAHMQDGMKKRMSDSMACPMMKSSEKTAEPAHEH